MTTTKPPQSKFVEVQGIRMHYWEWGRTGTPDLLLVHGWTGFGQTWSGVAEHFQDRYHVIAPDLRGHGASDKPHTGYRLRDFCEDIHQLIHAIGLRKPAYVGHSWGGNIGTYMASEYADDLSRAFLEDPVYWRMLHAFVTALPQSLARHNRPEAEIRADARKRGLSKADEDMEVYRAHHFSPLAITRLLSDNRDWAYACEEHMRRITVPTLVLVADVKAGGGILLEELAYYRRIASPQLQFRFWEGVGHAMRRTKPDQYNQELEEWLKGP